MPIWSGLKRSFVYDLVRAYLGYSRFICLILSIIMQLHNFYIHKSRVSNSLYLKEKYALCSVILIFSQVFKKYKSSGTEICYGNRIRLLSVGNIQ
ncbi:MAG: hypothetical protein D3910_04205 [Candidatus Electrothrix sp. ATG2]|nr:hypothetical protein [Candidatus Electrothrix sp. ATG2]